MASYTSNTDELSGSLVVAYGKHVVSGTIIQKLTVGTGDSAQTYVIVWLGEGVWNRIVSAYWAGAELSSTEYHFHNGYLATSMDEATYGLNTATGLDEWTQGVDPWNHGGQTYSGTAYVIVRLPVGVESDSNFSDLKFICECLRVANYNENGEQLDKDDNVVGTSSEAPKPEYFFYSTNPALVMADLLLYRRKIDKSRINWDKWVDWRDFNDVLITWVGGSVPDRPIYINNANGVIGSDSSYYKSSGGSAWNCGVVTESVFPDNTTSFFEFDAGAGTWSGGVTLGTSITNSNDLYIGFQGNAASPLDESGTLSLCRTGYSHTVIGSWVAGDRFRVGEENGELYVSINGVRQNFTLPGYVSGLHGAIALFHEGADIQRATMSPINVGTGAERQRKRFECGLAFVTQTDIAQAIASVLYVSCADMQDGEQLIFLPPSMAASPRTSIKSIDSSNMVEDSLRVYRLAREQKPTKMIGRFRDSDSPTLKEDTVPADRDELVGLLGRENPAPEMYLGTMTRGQAQCVINYQLRMSSDLDLYCSIQTDGTTWKVAPGDVVDITNDTMEWSEVEFKTIEATDDSSVDTPDFRTFLFQLHNRGAYSDDDQTPLSGDVINTITLYPPPATNLQATIDETLLSGFTIDFDFGVFDKLQRAKIYLKGPADIEPDDSQYNLMGTVLPDGNNHGHFEIRVLLGGSYWVKVQTQTEFPAGMTAPTGHPELQVNLRPLAPTNLSASLDSSGNWHIYAEGLPRAIEMPETYRIRLRKTDGTFLRDIPVFVGTTMAAVLTGVNPLTTPTIINNSAIATDSGSTYQAKTIQTLSIGSVITMVCKLPNTDASMTSYFSNIRFGLKDYSTASWNIVLAGGGPSPTVPATDNSTYLYYYNWTGGIPGVGTLQTGNMQVPSVDGRVYLRVVFSGSEVRVQAAGSPIVSTQPPLFILKNIPELPQPSVLSFTLWGGDEVNDPTKVENIMLGGMGYPQTIYSLAQQEEDNGGVGLTALDVEIWEISTSGVVGLSNREVFP